MPLSAVERKVVADLWLKAAQNGVPELVDMTVQGAHSINQDEVMAMNHPSERYTKYNLHHLRAVRLDDSAVYVYAIHSHTPVDKEDLPGLLARAYTTIDRSNLHLATRRMQKAALKIQEFIYNATERVEALVKETNCFRPRDPNWDEYDADLARQYRDRLMEASNSTYPDSPELGEYAGKRILPPIDIPELCTGRELGVLPE